MGAQPSTCVSILAQDYEFDDIFTKYAMKEYSCIHYAIGDKTKFKGEIFEAKKKLLDAMGMESFDTIPTLFTNGNGFCNSNDIEIFTEIVKKDLKSIVDTVGFTVQLLLTGQCAPLITIINKLLIDEYISPAKIEIFVINNKHNSYELFNELIKLNKTAYEFAITIEIKEFSAFNSMGPNAEQWVGDQNFIDCGTSEKFSNDIFELAKNNNKYAKGLIQYTLLSNKHILLDIVTKINQLTDTLDDLFIDNYPIDDYKIKINKYITNIIYLKSDESTDYSINIKLNQILYDDMIKIINIIKTLVLSDIANNRRLHYNLCSIPNDSSTKLKTLLKWLENKSIIIKYNFICFSLHDLALPLIYESSPSLSDFKSFGIKSAGYFDIVDVLPPNFNSSYLNVTHYASTNPEKTRHIMEKIVKNIIKNN
jgi:hypothetical protein